MMKLNGILVNQENPGSKNGENIMRHLISILIVLIAVTSNVQANKAQILENYGNIPLAFTLNQGQVDSQVKFTTSGNGCSLFFTPEGTTFLLNRETEESRAKRAAKRSVVYMDNPLADNEPDIELEHFALKLNFLNANPAPEIIGEDRLSWNSNYFIGNDPSQWQTDVPNYSRIRLKDVYDGIDLVYYGNKNKIKYDFIVQPGEDPSEIMLNYDFSGLEGLISINEKGELVVSTPLGDIIERKPYCYQVIEGEKIEIDISYDIVNSTEGSFRFSIGEYNHDYSLVIDPEIVYSTLIGGSNNDNGYNIEVDRSNNAYVTGNTLSIDFPVTSGVFDEMFNSISKWDSDAFIVKLNSDGSELVYATFVGGSDDDWGYSIAVDFYGNTYVTGETHSPDFPVTSGAFDESFNEGIFGDVYILKLNVDGSELVYATFVGGNALDQGMCIAVDENGNVYATGTTLSPDFPVTPGAFDETKNNIFILKLNTDGSELVYSTFIGGNGWDNGSSIALDESGNAYVTGRTAATDFPVTPGAYDETHNGGDDLYILKLNADGSALYYSTYIGGSDSDWGASIAVDENGCVYVTGYSASTDFPVTFGAYDETYNGGEYDVIILKLNAEGSDLVYSTYMGGNEWDSGNGIALDMNGCAYVTGFTKSTDFPATSGAFDETFNGGDRDAFIVKLNASGNALEYSSFIGGSGGDSGFSISVDINSCAYVTGYSNSSDFPITPGAFDESHNDSVDMFICKFYFPQTYVASLPVEFRVTPPYPNPFNATTTIRYEIPEDVHVRIVVYDILGRQVSVLHDGFNNAGVYNAVWNGKDNDGIITGSGVYLYKLKAGKYNSFGKIVLLR